MPLLAAYNCIFGTHCNFQSYSNFWGPSSSRYKVNMCRDGF